MRNKLVNILILLVSIASAVGIFYFYMPIRNIPIPFLFIGLCIVSTVYFTFYHIFLPKYSKRKMWLILFSSALLGVIFLLSTKGQQDYLKDNSFLAIMLAYFGSFLFITICIGLISMKVMGSNKVKHQKPAGFLDFGLYFMIIFLTGITYFLAFYPAGMSTDSLNSWNQAHTGQFNDWHPIMFTWTMMILSTIWDSPASMSLFQVTILSLVFAYSFWQFQKLGVSRYLLIAMSLIIAIIPSFGVFSIILWKDILFSASLLFFTIHLFLIMHTNGKWLVNKGNIVLFFLSSFGVVFFRHNGFPVFVLTMIVLILLYRKSVLKIAGSIFLILVVSHQILTGPIFKYLDVKPSDPNEALSIPTQQIANIIKKDGKLTSEQRQYYNRIFPIEMWKQKYNPYTVDPIKFSKNYHRDIIYDDFPYYLKTWGQIVIQNPSLAMEAYIKQTSLVWQMRTPQDGYIYQYRNGIIKNDYGLESKPINSSMNHVINQYLEASKVNPYVNFVWRPAFYALIILIFSLALLMKNGWKSSVVILPFLLNVLSILVALPAQDFRYLLANVFLSFVFPFMALIHPEQKKDVKSMGNLAEIK